VRHSDAEAAALPWVALYSDTLPCFLTDGRGSVEDRRRTMTSRERAAELLRDSLAFERHYVLEGRAEVPVDNVNTEVLRADIAAAIDAAVAAERERCALVAESVPWRVPGSGSEYGEAKEMCWDVAEAIRTLPGHHSWGDGDTEECTSGWHDDKAVAAAREEWLEEARHDGIDRDLADCD
jgi:hypothetical protein